MRLKRTSSIPAKRASLPRLASSARTATAPRLRHRLDDDHAGHDRTAREVARQEPLVLPHELACDDARTGLEHRDLVQEEERIAVRQDLFDLLPPQGDGHAGVYSSSSVRRRARARWT